MLKKVVIGAIMGGICAFSGYLIASQIPSFSHLWWAGWAGAAGGLLVTFLTLALEEVIKRIPLKTILGGTLGLFIGLGIAKLASYPFDKFLDLPNLQIPLYIIFSAIFGYIGLVLGGKKMSEVSTPYFLESPKQTRMPLKILDTSVIIDGRIADIGETGFLEGTFIVPKFILEELQYIADSPDDLRRTRGRRGLDILKRLQQNNRLKVEFVEDDVPKAGVDSKLVALALKMRAKILTNDFNLHKVAELQGIQVLNINQLANAMKPAVLPGETLQVQILREGKSQGQGVAYLDDGTMVVIENARRFIGREVEVNVTSVLQTTAGRMIFSEIKDASEKSLRIKG
ncbi:MAG: TRAM domain-containing protein [Deltaproteobacteria bacterium]|nr:TRAM domain-containing protein [Deltaproteobacteria bacterium]